MCMHAAIQPTVHLPLQPARRAIYHITQDVGYPGQVVALRYTRCMEGMRLDADHGSSAMSPCYQIALVIALLHFGNSDAALSLSRLVSDTLDHFQVSALLPLAKRHLRSLMSSALRSAVRMTSRHIAFQS